MSASSADGKSADDRLGSWKEIAVYLKSGVRTVQRWERLENLPVHRHLHNKQGTVYAFKSEIAAWQKQRRPLPTELTPSGNGHDAGREAAQDGDAKAAEQLPPDPAAPRDLDQEADGAAVAAVSPPPPQAEPQGNGWPSVPPAAVSSSPAQAELHENGWPSVPSAAVSSPPLQAESLGNGWAPPQPEPALPVHAIRTVTNPPVLEVPPARTGVRHTVTIGLALAVLALMVLTAFLIRRTLRAEVKPLGGRVMLAVLPFVNLAGDQEEEYFSDGLTEEMITALGRMDVARLGVIARTSSMKYKHTNEDVAEIGRELGVEYILEGSVRRAGKGARISVQLIQVSDQTHLWTQNYERPLGDPLTVQEDVAKAVADRIFAALARPAPARVNNPRPVDPEAHEDYLKGRYFWNRRSPDGLQKGIEYFSRAVEKDPDYALAYSGLADCYTLLGLEGVPSTEVVPKAKAAALQSVELDDSLAQAHTSLGGVKAFYDWDWPGAEIEFKRAIALNANYAPAHHWYANLCLLPQRRFTEAIAEMKRALELDPVSSIINTDLGWTYDLAGQPEKALEQFRRTRELDPDFVALNNRLAQFYVHRGLYSEAVALTARQLKMGGHPERASAVEREFTTGGYRKVEETWLDRVAATPGR